MKWGIRAAVGLGLAIVGVGGWVALGSAPDSSASNCAALAAVLDAGRALERDIGRVVRPAIARTTEFAAQRSVMDSLRSNDRDAQTSLINEEMRRSTEIDALALFDRSGRITAINTVYATGAPIETARVDRIMKMDFSDREIIQRCVRNTSEKDVLEFQTGCDITPAFFDSSGLSVAYSAPVIDRQTGVRCGVASARLRFDRLSDLLRERSVGEAGDSFQFVTESGRYFSEDINAGRSSPRIPPEEMRALVAGARRGEAVAHWGDRLVCTFPLTGFRTLDGGSIHVVADVPEAWAAHEARLARRLWGGLIALVGLMSVLLGAAGSSLSSARDARAQSEIARRALESASRAKSEFLANMSHEIRTPMTAILGFAELLEDREQTAEQHRDRVTAIRRSGDHLLGIINDVLDLSKIEAGCFTLQSSRCSVCSIVGEVAAMMRVRAACKGIELDVEYVFPIPETIESDPMRIRQILLNLIGNAVKFTERGAVRLRVICEVPARGEPSIVVEVADSGIGMTESQLQLIFHPFSQADGSTSRKYGGTGLGLTISRRLAQMLGGDIAVRSVPGVGSVFSLRVRTGDLAGVRMIHDATETVMPTSPDRAADVRLAGRILLAEDGPDNQRLLSFLLRKAGAEVELAPNGRVAMEAALRARDQGRPFDLILMDMQMPEMDGYQATNELRKRGFDTPIVALTAHALAGESDKCKAAGCDDYASKPIDRRTLLEVCERWLERSPVAA